MRFAELTTRLGQDPILTRILVRTLCGVPEVTADVRTRIRRARAPAVTAGAVRFSQRSYCDDHRQHRPSGDRDEGTVPVDFHHGSPFVTARPST